MVIIKLAGIFAFGFWQVGTRNGGDTREGAMKVGGSLANDAVGGVVSPPERLRVGDGLATLNRKVVERLRATDGELRAKIRKEALINSGAPHFIDTRGPDLGLYTVDGMVLGGLTGQKVLGAATAKTPPTSDVPQKLDPARPGVPAGSPLPQETPPEAVSTGFAGATKAVAAYKPAPGLKPGAGAPVGVSKDLKA